MQLADLQKGDTFIYKDECYILAENVLECNAKVRCVKVMFKLSDGWLPFQGRYSEQFTTDTYVTPVTLSVNPVETSANVK